ncbi:MAG TPA: DUF5658 family protein [Vicinamibacterales bacterium]|nr:DUF5658 family protein [Vicinamibacterales bacterium]
MLARCPGSIVVVVLLAAAAPAAAQPAAAQPSTSTSIATPAPVAQAIVVPPVVAARAPRPAALVPLYISFAALQALDVQSTGLAIATGRAREANDAMRVVVDHPAAFIALKAGATAGTIWASERLFPHHRRAALIFMTIANAAMTAVVVHNYAVVR